MRYLSFVIENFKGIKRTEVNLQNIGGASVFALVGLNESGKTTILEAIHSFSPDITNKELMGGDDGIATSFAHRVPRHLIAEFTGKISVIAKVQVYDTDRAEIAKDVKEDLELTLDINAIPDEITFSRVQTFENGDFISNTFVCDAPVRVKSKGQRVWRAPSAKEKEEITERMYWMTPDISYFPTFVFEFPARIFLTNRGNKLDSFYRRVFQDILNADGRGHTIEKDIVRRLRAPELKIPWANFLPLFGGRDEKAKIQNVIDRASAIVTRVVFGRWNEIFREQAGNKEIIVTFETEEGKVKNNQGQIVSSNNHDIWIKFQIKDGTRRFDVNDRSLGFRWFFAFMLFTQFRISRNSVRPVLFLFDEPAANLHAAAQQKLIDCFPEIAKNGHSLMYTTHSHYMIEPKWLEQTFIVTNRADAPASKSVIDAVSFDDESLDIKCASYRSFVNSHSNQTDYFQPILDRLEVVPSRFDWNKSSIILEGRSDYYVLRYAARMLNRKDLYLIPGLGAGTFGNLVALSVGWNLNFLFVLDGDKQGRQEKKRYTDEFAVPADRFVTISEFDKSIVVIEDLLDDSARDYIKTVLGLKQKPSKPEIKRFFQERLASDRIETLSPGFSAAAKLLLDGLESRL